MKLRYRIQINGVVQGVGFRPFVYNLAKSLNLKGFVSNNTTGVVIEIEGENTLLNKFLNRLKEERPSISQIYKIKIEKLQPKNYQDFIIEKSISNEEITLDILPDIATCKYCLEEMCDPLNRRYLYPFINCTLCGPRFTIIESLPYDRENTVMRKFKMCSKCYKEYKDPKDRRFHAQPIACPKCGPYLELYDKNKKKIAEREKALDFTIKFLKENKIIAIKGIGGFHIICNATNEEIINILRKRKKRLKKPFAVMFKDLKQIEKYCYLTLEEKKLLTSPSSPIVLLESKGKLPKNIAPGLKKIGAFLPYSPLHHLILYKIDFPIIATSGNFSEEPIIIDNEEAFKKLVYIADYILVHNRDIKRRADDSVIKVINKIPTFIRRARGYTPLPIFLPFKIKKRVLAVGPREKNTFAIAFNNKIILSQHLGDIDTLENLKVFEEAIFDFMNLYKFKPDIIVADLHPGYETTKWAEEFSKKEKIPLIKVQHHFAHILSCIAENELFEDEVLGISWDGTGYGEDGTVWGGEFLIVKKGNYKRITTFRNFKLIGSEKAIKDARRIALSLLFEIYGEKAFELPLKFLKTFSENELKALYIAWKKGINSPLCSSVGRLFDAISALIDLNYFNTYEGESPMMLEELVDLRLKDYYPFGIKNKFYIDWEPMIKEIVEKKENPKIVASKFINTLAKICEEIALKIGIKNVALSGGVMVNRPLIERITELLTKKGFKVFQQKMVPPNDGGLSLGQALYPILQAARE